MRALLIALPLMLAATPALAAAQAAPQLPPELSDPAMADKLGEMAGALTKALMDMPVGEIEAAVAGPRADAGRPGASGSATRSAGRTPSATSRPRVAPSGRQMQAMSKALVASLPSIMAALDEVEQRARARHRQHSRPDLPEALTSLRRAQRRGNPTGAGLLRFCSQ